MALSDELSKLAVRAQEADKRAGAAAEMAKSDLEANRDFARARGEEQAEDLPAVAEKGHEQISDAWKEMQITWNHATAALREDVESRKAEHDLRKAQRRARQGGGRCPVRNQLRLFSDRRGRVLRARRRAGADGGG